VPVMATCFGGQSPKKDSDVPMSPRSMADVARVTCHCYFAIGALLLLALFSQRHHVDYTDSRQVHGIIADFNEVTPTSCSDPDILTYQEKHKWRKAHDRNPIWPIVGDKRLLRDFAKSRDVAMPPLIYASQNCDALPKLSTLPRDFAFKASHTCGCNMIVIGGNVSAHKRCRFDQDLVGAKVTDSMLQQLCLNWIGQKYERTNEWAYQVMPPSVVIERLLYRGSQAQSLQGIADDLKCFSFNGQTAYVMQVSQRFVRGRKTDTFYEPNGKPRPDIRHGGNSLSQPLPPESYLDPAVIQRAAAFCEQAARGFDHARVDLLQSADGSLFLGEISPYSSVANFQPASLAMELSQRWCLPLDTGFGGL